MSTNNAPAPHFKRLLSIARDSRVKVHFIDNEVTSQIDWDGLYVVTPELGAGIAIRKDLSPEWRDWILAHELGHHFSQMNGTLFSPFRAHKVNAATKSRWEKSKLLDPDEENANLWAVRELVNETSWDTAERQSPCDLRSVIKRLGLPFPAAIAWERRTRRSFRGHQVQVPLTSELNEVLTRPISGRGGHQSFLERLKQKRRGKSIAVSYEDFSYARERAAQVQGGWLTRYLVFLAAVKPLIKDAGTSRALFNLRPICAGQ